jgi:hypothetical protein
MYVQGKPIVIIRISVLINLDETEEGCGAALESGSTMRFMMTQTRIP